MHTLKKSTGVLAFIIVFISLFVISPSMIEAREPQNVLIVGWDGARREAVKEMLAGRELPNLSVLIKEGRLVDIDVTTGATDTKAGWCQILTGYTPEITGVYGNGHYRPIPEGMTILERVEKALGDNNVYTAIIAGKSINVDNDAPKKVPYEWWMRHSATSQILEMISPKSRIEKIGSAIVEENGKKYVSIPGKIFYLTQKGIDTFVNGLGDNGKTAGFAINTLVKIRKARFLITVIFNEPDNSGHKYGEGSKGYKNALRLCDQWTGALMVKLRELDLYDRTLIYVVSDHGFDAGRRTHNKASRIFCATNDKHVSRNGNRTDIAPTVLKRFGIDPAKISPSLTGRSLDQTLPAVKH